MLTMIMVSYACDKEGITTICESILRKIIMNVVHYIAKNPKMINQYVEGVGLGDEIQAPVSFLRL